MRISVTYEPSTYEASLFWASTLQNGRTIRGVQFEMKIVEEDEDGGDYDEYEDYDD